MSDIEDVRFQAAIIAAAREAAKPYQSELDELKGQLRELRQFREIAERHARFADEDARRNAEHLKEDTEKHAEAKAREVVKQAFQSLDIDLERPGDFISLIRQCKEFITSVKGAGRQAVIITMTSIVGGALLLFWNGFKGSLFK